MKEFYLQDSRSYTGNDLMFWAKDRAGYTTDVSKAMVFTEQQAQDQHNIRETDIPWPKEYIDAHTRPAVDFQYVNKTKALEGTSIVLKKAPHRKAELSHCHHCGSFMNEAQRYMCGCPKCGEDNRP